MKICHMTIVHQRYDIRIFVKECSSLANAGNEVFYIVNDNQEDEEINGVKIISLKKPPKNRLFRFLSFSVYRKLLKKAKELKADIYHFHDPELLRIGVKLKKLGFKVVYDSHEDVPRQILSKEWIPRIFRRTVSKLYEKFENNCVAKFDAVITATPYIRDRFSQFNKNVREVCNFPSTKDIKYSGDNYSNKNPTCYIGDLSYTRGIIQIAEATSKSNFKLRLSGMFASKGIMDEINQYDHIEYLGFLNRIQISELLSKSSIGLVTLLNTPNYINAYPIKLFEYMAAGIPVIASNFPIYKSIVEGYNCGICVDPLDVNAISKAINKITNDKEYADNLRINGYQAIIDKFNWESQVNTLLDSYNKILLDNDNF